MNRNCLFVLIVAVALVSCHREAKVNPELVCIDTVQLVDLRADAWEMDMGSFRDKKQCEAVNRLSDDAEYYDGFMAALQEYCPMIVPDSATPYERYRVARMQFDSLTAFEPAGSTYTMYKYEDLRGLFDRINSDRMRSELSRCGLYTAEQDLAWKIYFATMTWVCDSVVMWRPESLGTMSRMSAITFTRAIEAERDQYVRDLYFLPDSAYIPEVHASVTHTEILAAYTKLLRYQSSGEEDELVAPVAERQRAIRAEIESFRRLCETLADCIDQLPPSYRKDAFNALNNLRRHKLVLLKNLYAIYDIRDATFDSVPLPQTCTDDELRRYDYVRRYHEVYGWNPTYN